MYASRNWLGTELNSLLDYQKCTPTQRFVVGARFLKQKLKMNLGGYNEISSNWLESMPHWCKAIHAVGLWSENWVEIRNGAMNSTVLILIVHTQ